LPNLEDIRLDIRRLALRLNDRVNAFEVEGVDLDAKNLNEVAVLVNLRDCVKSAASIVSSASTILDVSHPDRVSIWNGSEFGHFFPRELNEPMQRRMTSISTVDGGEARDRIISCSRRTKLAKPDITITAIILTLNRRRLRRLRHF
jgi:hypothetical protein